MLDRVNKETESTATMEEQLEMVQTLGELLDQPDGEAKAKAALIEYWEKLRKRENQRVN